MASNATDVSGYYASNSTQINNILHNSNHGNHSLLLVVMLPILAVLLLFVLLAVDCISISNARRHGRLTVKQKRRQRLFGLEAKIHSQSFKSWVKASNLERGENNSSEEDNTIVCAICLEVINNRALVRGLECHHVFHQSCLDEWFIHFKNFCPLCRRCIIAPANAIEERRIPEIPVEEI